MDMSTRGRSCGELPWLFAMSLASAGVLGCSDSSESVPQVRRACESVSQECAAASDVSACEVEKNRECATAFFTTGYSSNNEPACLGSPESLPQINHTLTTRLFLGSNVDDVDAQVHTRGLQRYYEPHSLRFEVPAPGRSTSITYAIEGDQQAVVDALTAAGISPYEDPVGEERERALQVVSDVLYAPIKNFLKQEASPAKNELNVIVLTAMVSPSAKALLGFEGEVLGLGISPAVIESLKDDPSGQYLHLLAPSESFTPTLFLGSETITAHLKIPDYVVAHECGHLFGLVHVEQAWNLMYRYAQQGCRPAMTSQQVDQLVLGPVSPMSLKRRSLETLPPTWATVPSRVLERIRGGMSLSSGEGRGNGGNK